MSERLDELKQEADELGISYNPRIGEDKLQAKIDEHYTSQETSSKEVEQAVQAKEATVSEAEAEKPAVSGRKPIAIVARENYEKAKKTRVVTITDNDQRVNNQTTTCVANWSNAYYDLGTKRFPLNTPIEIEQGFINVLKEVRIPHHSRDMKSGLSKTTMRPRYSISFEDVDNN